MHGGLCESRKLRFLKGEAGFFITEIYFGFEDFWKSSDRMYFCKEPRFDPQYTSTIFRFLDSREKDQQTLGLLHWYKLIPRCHRQGSFMGLLNRRR